jgi:RNA polymerase sigma factor FliA
VKPVPMEIHMAQERANEFPSTKRWAGIRALEAAFRECELKYGRPATNVEVCEKLGMTLEELCYQLEQFSWLDIGRFETLGKDRTSPGQFVRYLPCMNERETCYVIPREEFRSGLNEAVSALPTNEQLVMFFHYSQKMSVAEIAQRTGLSESRVAQIHTTSMLRIRPRLMGLGTAGLSISTPVAAA